MLANLLRRGSPNVEAANLIMRKRPDIPSDLAPAIASPRPEAILDEYARLSKSIGFANPHIDGDLKVENFKAFLRLKDWPIFSLPTVIAYMDKKSAEDSTAKAGWHWRPLRSRDDIKNARFGTQAHAWGHDPNQKRPASDHYTGPHVEKQMQRSNSSQHPEEKQTEVSASGLPYDKLVPIHALRKIAEIEKSFPGKVSFFVCDYAPAPHIEHPDPFLMAVIDNARLNQGVGRFVIDFWDEPGFGLEQQLA